MAIYAPGIRDHHNRPKRNIARSAIMSLSLTAMVDMFTVLAVFLLQSYQTTGEVIDISDEVQLPKASAVKELKPAHVVVISKERIVLDKDVVATFTEVKEQKDWMIVNLQQKLQDAFKAGAEKRKALGGAIRDTVQQANAPKDENGQPLDPEKIAEEDDHRVTVQADRTIDFLTIKKVMYTVSEAGGGQINFAVLKNDVPVTQ